MSQIENNNEISMLVITISVIILAILWFKIIFSNSSLPPGPPSLPIVGYLPFLSHDLPKHFTNMAHTYGPIFKMKLGSKLYVVINSPDLAKVVVRDQDEIFSNRDPPGAALALTYGGQDVVWSKNNDNWRKLRKLFVHEVLSSKNLQETSSFRREEVRKGVKSIFGKIGSAIKIREIAISVETNFLTRTLWGNTSEERVKCQNLGADIDMVASNTVEIFRRVNLSDFFPSLARFDLQGVDRDMKVQRDKLDKLFTSIIEDRIKCNFERSQEESEHGMKKDFVEILLDHRDEKDGKPLSMTQIKALLLDIMIAGTETTTTTLEWAMACIMNNHNILKKVQEELAETVGPTNIVEESHLPKLKYVDATIKETLRMYPVVPLLPQRSPSKTCTVGGYTIPKDCTVILNVWSIHHDPRYWDNPLEFNPERFLTDKWDYNGKNLVYFPFGSGRRICPGIPLAEKMLVFILASLLYSFDWSLPKGEEHDFTEIFGITLRRKKPLVAIPSQRLSNVKLYM